MTWKYCQKKYIHTDTFWCMHLFTYIYIIISIYKICTIGHENKFRLPKRFHAAEKNKSLTTLITKEDHKASTVITRSRVVSLVVLCTRCEIKHSLNSIWCYSPVWKRVLQATHTLQYSLDVLLNVTKWNHCLQILVISPCQKIHQRLCDHLSLFRKLRTLLSCW